MGQDQAFELPNVIDPQIKYELLFSGSQPTLVITPSVQCLRGLARGGYASPSNPNPCAVSVIDPPSPPATTNADDVPRFASAVSRRRGRASREARDQLVQLRCTPSERDRWREKAKASGQSLSVFLREALDGAPVRRRRRHTAVDPALVRELARVGNNLNQLSKWANRDRSSVDALAVIARLVEIDRELRTIREAAARPIATSATAYGEVDPNDGAPSR